MKLEHKHKETNLIRRFIVKNEDNLQGKTIEHNIVGLKEYKPGRHINTNYFYGVKCVLNKNLDLKELRLTEV